MISSQYANEMNFKEDTFWWLTGVGLGALAMCQNLTNGRICIIFEFIEFFRNMICPPPHSFCFPMQCNLPMLFQNYFQTLMNVNPTPVAMEVPALTAGIPSPVFASQAMLDCTVMKVCLLQFPWDLSV